MKKLKYLLILSVMYNLAYSQDTIVTYYNQDWKKIDNKDYASFFRKSFKDSASTWAAQNYYISGKIQMKGTFRTKYDNREIGLFVYYYENGQVSAKGEFIKGLKTGKWLYWYENGQLKSEGEFVEGKANGLWQYWHENGEKKSEGNYMKDKQSGKWMFWYEDKVIQSTGDFKNSLKEGLWIDYYKNGQKSFEATFKDNLLNGECTYWLKSGELAAKGVFIRGYKDGIWQGWHKNGKLKFKETYLKQLLISSEGYHSNGEPYFIGNFRNGLRSGHWIFSNVNGRKYFEGKFSRGKHTGEWIRYFADSELKLFYVNGELKNKKLGGLVVNSVKE
jgi:antitoxin component YwqK of YwqJK toxin-antitoxin module